MKEYVLQRGNQITILTPEELKKIHEYVDEYYNTTEYMEYITDMNISDSSKDFLKSNIYPMLNDDANHIIEHDPKYDIIDRYLHKHYDGILDIYLEKSNYDKIDKDYIKGNSFGICQMFDEQDAVYTDDDIKKAIEAYMDNHGYNEDDDMEDDEDDN